MKCQKTNLKKIQRTPKTNKKVLENYQKYAKYYYNLQKTTQNFWQNYHKLFFAIKKKYKIA